MVDASDASNHREMFKSLGKGGTKENVMLVSPSGSVALNSPITVPMAEFSAMVRLLAYSPGQSSLNGSADCAQSFHAPQFSTM